MTPKEIAVKIHDMLFEGIAGCDYDEDVARIARIIKEAQAEAFEKGYTCQVQGFIGNSVEKARAEALADCKKLCKCEGLKNGI